MVVVEIIDKINVGAGKLFLKIESNPRCIILENYRERER